MLLGMLRGESGTVAVVVFLDGAPVEVSCTSRLTARASTGPVSITTSLVQSGTGCPGSAGAGPSDLTRAARACRTGHWGPVRQALLCRPTAPTRRLLRRSAWLFLLPCPASGQSPKCSPPRQPHSEQQVYSVILSSP